MLNKYENGLKIRRKVIGKQTSDIVTNNLKNIAPILDKKIMAGFDEIEHRDALNMKQRELITISSLVTQGDTERQLMVHIKAGLNVGITKNEIIETLIHLVSYVGFPKVLNAISVAKKVFEKL